MTDNPEAWAYVLLLLALPLGVAAWVLYIRAVLARSRNPDEIRDDPFALPCPNFRCHEPDRPT